ncbi:hypothetical protein CONPUDRAFT_160018 [Coniophora puteana RWD-64-598 SS2]|uniref:Extracellular metalloproteinase n=1 Tax=Coniophora puteana (strain RWD-64-598) TaxID=741705 RepID=R7SFU2_CONPW|nr:uncharacterized protein CONPUDRAFT_160018 [Coniophora puteana RWD-64-598 SS2]EIW74725.1 hypothetical protein CONPUDRAFT_160018 [Coniophora puteana RWD-64-598 SS2]
MRALLTVPLLLATHAVARKSLSIGPQLPHAYYSAEPTSYTYAIAVESSDPFSVASAFLRDLLSSNVSYVIREDSYTDTISGISHIYARQLVSGLDVANAHINLNIRNGVVLSYGNSFYTGPQMPPVDSASSTINPYLTFCEGLRARLNGLLDVQTPRVGYQVLLSHQPDKAVHVMHMRMETYCAHAHIASDIALAGLEPSAETALLYFVIVATADPFVSESILKDPQQHLGALQVNALQDAGSYSISGVPGAMGDVITRLVYVQVPDDTGNTILALAHRFRVNFLSNSYEAYVSISSPHRILSVVDYTFDGDPDTDIVSYSGTKPAPSTTRTSIEQRRKTFEPGCYPTPDVTLPDLIPSTYRVFQWGYNDPSEALSKSGIPPGDPSSLPYDEARSFQQENVDSVAARAGWHTLPNCRVPDSPDGCDDLAGFWHTTDTTFGNNVFVQEDWKGYGRWTDNKRPIASVSDNGQIFDFPYNPTGYEDEDEAEKLKNAHSYGFDEVSGNFQQWNFGRCGEEDDAVILNIQKGNGFNRGSMSVPGDGEAAICDLYLFDHSNPYRDTAMTADVTIHELTHGLTTRLVGGPSTSSCLGQGEAKGMSEGWSDYVTTMVRATDPHAEYAMGEWISNKEGGARRYPFTTDRKKNPTTYETVTEYFKSSKDVYHDVGTIWGNMLWAATIYLSEKRGFSSSLFPPSPLPDGSLPSSAFEGSDSFYLPRTVDPATGLFSPPVPRRGNTLMLQLVINALKLMPCSPKLDFKNGRDTIIEADQHLTNGANECELWAAFAERGLGVDARVMPAGLLANDAQRSNGFEVPEKCKDITKKLA